MSTQHTQTAALSCPSPNPHPSPLILVPLRPSLPADTCPPLAFNYLSSPRLRPFFPTSLSSPHIHSRTPRWFSPLYLPLSTEISRFLEQLPPFVSGTLAPKDRSGWVAQYCPLEMAPVPTGHALRLALLAAATPACLHPKSLQSCSTLCDPMDCSPSGSSVHGILQARILE